MKPDVHLVQENGNNTYRIYAGNLQAYSPFGSSSDDRDLIHDPTVQKVRIHSSIDLLYYFIFDCIQGTKP